MFFQTENSTITQGPVPLPHVWVAPDGNQYHLRELWKAGHQSDVIALGWLPQVITGQAGELEDHIDWTHTISGNQVDSTPVTVAKFVAEVKDILIRAVHSKVSEHQLAISDPLDSLRQVKTSLLQGQRGKGKPLSAEDTAFLDAMETDPRVLAAVSLLAAAEAIITDINAGTITTLDAVSNDPRWP